MAASHADSPPEPPTLWSFDSARFHMLLLLLSVTFTTGLIRGSIGPLIVCMQMRIKQSALHTGQPGRITLSWRDILYNNDLYGASLSCKQQSYIHSSYYCGGIFGIVISYLLMLRLGTKRILYFGLLISALACFAMPALVIAVPYYSLLFLRLTMGFGNGLVVPCSIAIVRKWFPPKEEDMAIIALFISNHAGSAGSIIITLFSGKINIFGGWTLASLLYAIIGFSIATLWKLRGADKPRHSNYVTATELDYLRGRRIRKATLNRSDLQTPFKKIIFSPCVIAACSSCYTYSFITSSTLAYLPVFNYHTLGMGLILNGITSSLPLLIYASGISAFCVLLLFLERHDISLTAAIKAFSCIGTSGLSLCLIVLLVTDTSHAALLTLTQSIGLGFLSIFSLACIVCVKTVAPQFTVFIFSYTELYAQLAGVFSPIVVEMLSAENGSSQWQVLVCLLVLLILSELNFLLFAHGRHEITVERHVRSLSLSRSHAYGEGSNREEIQALESELPMKSSAVSVMFAEGEAMIPLRYEGLPSEELASLTSDDDY